MGNPELQFPILYIKPFKDLLYLTIQTSIPSDIFAPIPIPTPTLLNLPSDIFFPSRPTPQTKFQVTVIFVLWDVFWRN